MMEYFLQHRRDAFQYRSASSLAQCRSDFFRQWRDPDGSIPWRMYVKLHGQEPVEVNPFSA